MPDHILTVNAGSSSVKFQVFKAEGEALELDLKAQIDGIGTQAKIRATDANGAIVADRALAQTEAGNVAEALDTTAKWLRERYDVEPAAIGHRVVHGGPKYSRPVFVDANVLADLERFVPLAPLHQPNNLAPIRTILERYPDRPQVACFDTAFHHEHSAVAKHFALPEQFFAEGVRRYGFHGLSYEYIAERLKDVAPDYARARVIVAHLGSGASMCALFEGRSVESTMGFTALDGLPMGTRPGQIDPGVVLYLFAQKRMDVDAVQRFLYNECGLRGLSGISNDVRELERSSEPAAAFALEYFVYRVALYAGTLAAALGGVDAFVFTAGIGENSASIRAKVAKKLAWLGAALDSAANAKHATTISRSDSRVALYVIPTDEELMIARHTLALLAGRKVPS
ncbi:MAG: acetate/propionate family kinase [Candidatus Eremiobacteraeota bacterium]|nr:acetate/propionate family kinase [Candidatus Eremiobacteraeota bacterium]